MAALREQAARLMDSRALAGSATSSIPFSEEHPPGWAASPRRGGDLQQQVTLTFEESVFGASREIEINRLEMCHHCSGAGNEPGTTVDTCTDCRGSGQVRRSQRSVFGQFTQVAPCPSCRGQGSIINSPCTVCRGAGRERRKRKIEVKIPSGIDHGMQVRINGEGDVGSDGGGSGNLYVAVAVQEHNLFQRDGTDIVYTLPLNVAEAALGVEKSIPTVDGFDEELKLPQGTQPGAEFRDPQQGNTSPAFQPSRRYESVRRCAHPHLTLRAPEGVDGRIGYVVQWRGNAQNAAQEEVEGVRQDSQQWCQAGAVGGS